MRIVHSPFVLQSQQHSIASNPFQDNNSTITSNINNNNNSDNNNINNNPISTSNYLGNTQINNNNSNSNSNNITLNSNINNTSITTNLNGNTEEIVEKLSSIYGHIDDLQINTTTNELNSNLNSNEIISSNNTTNLNSFTNNFNSSFNNINNFNLNNYFNNYTINYDCGLINVNDNNNEDNNENSLSLNNVIINDDLEQYKNTLVNDQNNQKTILNNLNRLNDNQQQLINNGNKKLANSNNIILGDNNNTNDIFLENLNVLCAKQDIKSPSSIEDFNIKTITGFNKLKSLQYYSDSSSQSSSEEEIDDEDDDIDDDDDDVDDEYDEDNINNKNVDGNENNENDNNDDDDENENENEYISDDNDDNIIIERKTKNVELENKENNENNIDNDNEDDDQEQNNEDLNESLSKNLNNRRDSVKLTNKITEFTTNKIRGAGGIIQVELTTTSPLSSSTSIVIESEGRTVIGAKKSSSKKSTIKIKNSSGINKKLTTISSPKIILSRPLTLTSNKMAGDNEKNVTNPEENEVYSETESVEMKSLHDDNGRINDICEDMEIDKNSDILDIDNNDIKDIIEDDNKNVNDINDTGIEGDNDDDDDVDDDNDNVNNDLVENCIQNQDSDNISTKRRCSSPAGCVSSDSTISEKSFPNDEDDGKVTNTTSPSLSFASANSSNGTNNADYPRGIINPNYPGFQHLAHTLSEHFVNHPNDADDSDLSEFEVELSIDDDIVAGFNNATNITKEENQIIESPLVNDLPSPLDSPLSPPPVPPSSFDDKKLNADVTMKFNTNSPKFVSQHDEYHHNLMEVTNKIKDIREHKEILLPEIRISFECHDLKLEERFDLKDSPKRLAITTSQEKVPKVYNKIDKGNKMINEKLTKSPPPSPTSLQLRMEMQQQKQRVISSNDNTNIVEDISCDLDTYLKKYETGTDIKMKPINKFEHHEEATSLENQIKSDKFEMQDTKINENELDEARNCPTPDILIKNSANDFRRHKNSVTGNRPDLLRNVSPQPPACEEYQNLLRSQSQSSEESSLHDETKLEDHKFNLIQQDETIQSTKIVDESYNIKSSCIPITSSAKLCNDDKKISRIMIPDISIDNRRSGEQKEDSSFGTTPVDIVGDFGREVEREFGLLVSGYNSRILMNRDPSPINIKKINGNESPSPTRIENHEKKFIQKMADAHLSDAKENINFGQSSINTTSCSNLINGSKPASMVANIVVARATLNNPTTDLIMTSTAKLNSNQNNMPCDLLMETANKFGGVKTTQSSVDSDLKVTLQIQQKQQNQEQKIIEEKLLPSLLVSSTSNMERPAKKIPPPPPPRRFLQQQLQQMQKRQQELQQQKQQQLKQQQRQIEKQKYTNIVSHNNPFVSAVSANQIDFNKTNQTITAATETIQATPATTKINANEKLSKNKILSTSQQIAAVQDTQINGINKTTINEINDSDSVCSSVDVSEQIILESTTLNDIIITENSTAERKNTLTSVATLQKNQEEKQAEVEIDAKEENEEKTKQKIETQSQQQQQIKATATVKSKYQKFSYDDRQLPPVGIGVFEQNSRPWYEEQKIKYEKSHNYNSTATTTLTTTTSATGNNCNAGETRKTRKNHLNANLSSYKSDQRSVNNSNDGNGTPKITVKKLHSRSSHTNEHYNQHHHHHNQQQIHNNSNNCGNNNSQLSIDNIEQDNNHRSSSSQSINHTNRHSSSRYHHSHHHHHHHHHHSHHNRNYSNKNSILKENTTTITTSINGNNNSAINDNGFVAIVTPRKKEKIIPNDDEFIRHDIYKSLTKQYNNNNNNNKINDMNNRSIGGVGGGGFVNNIGYGNNGGGTILIDNSYRTIRNEVTSKYILNLNNHNNNNNNNNNSNYNNNNNMINSGSNGIYKSGGNKNGKTSSSNSSSFDVYNIETALPSIDMDAIETHLQKAKEEEKKVIAFLLIKALYCI
ncbi:homeobox protein 5-like isoform X2 [Condylostylus longicornis]|uniref:homeobox protein 5-like isoform X2 n=1 Tax=Condylostylus longicornis TaxID=2530218 RepID=UPI00244DE368|nr:homeobox protein 5-like isoform X2 [Condylostylus longicornis]